MPYLLPQFEEAFPALHSNFGEHRDKFCRFLAAIACFSTINPREHAWLKRFLSAVTVEERAMWAWSIQVMLKEMKESAVPTAWSTWIREYWQDRLDGIPVRLDPKETRAMVHWTLHLKTVFPEAVNKVCDGPTPEMRDASNYLYHELSESDLPTCHPVSAVKLLSYLLENDAASYWDLDSIEKVVRKITVSPANKKNLLGICNSLARLGHPGASSLRDSIEAADQG